MPRIAPFETYHRRYEDWFGRHGPAYGSELLAIRATLPWNGRGLEVGVGLPRPCRTSSPSATDGDGAPSW